MFLPKKKNDHHSFIIKSYKFEHWKILNKGLNLKVSKIIPEKKKIGWTHMQRCPKRVPVQYVSNMDSGHMTRSEVFESQKHFLNQVWDLRDVLTSGTKYWGWCTRVGTLAIYLLKWWGWWKCLLALWIDVYIIYYSKII